MYHVTKALIDTAAIQHNYLAIRDRIRQTSEGAAVMCVLKADGYGHGALTCAKIYHALGARHFAVSNLDEALEIREAVPDSMLLILGYTDPAHAEVLRKHQITQTVFSLDYAKALSQHLKGALNIRPQSRYRHEPFGLQSQRTGRGAGGAGRGAAFSG